MSRRPRHDEGAVGILAAASLTMLIGFGAIAVDTSYLYFGKRNLQAATDAAALSAAQDLSKAQQIVNATFVRQGISDANPTATTGIYNDLAASRDTRFAAPTGGAPLSAVRVVADRTVPLGLSRILFGPKIAHLHATATAAYVPAAAFTLSSTTAALDGGLLNSLLSALLDGSISLSLASYQSLLNTNVSLLKTLDQLAVNIGAQAGTYDSLANTSASVGKVLSAAADVLNAGGTTTPAGTALLSLASQVNPSLSLRLGDLISLGLMKGASTGASGEGSSYTDLGLNALQLVQTSAALGGKNAVSTNTIINVPGVMKVATQLSIVEPPATAPAPPAEGMMVLGPVGSKAQTAQVRLLLKVTLPNISLLGISVGLGELPVLLQVAPATATLTRVDCSAGPDQTYIDILTKTGLVTAAIGNVTDLSANPTGTLTTTPATLVNVSLLGLVKVTATVRTKSAITLGTNQQTLTFTPTQIKAHTPQSISSTNQVTGLMQSLGNSNLDVQVKLDLLSILPVNLDASAVVSAITAVVSPALSALDPLLNSILAALGVKLGIAEVTPGGARCGVPVLVM